MSPEELKKIAEQYAQTCLELQTPFLTHVDDFINGANFILSLQAKSEQAEKLILDVFSSITNKSL